MALPTPSDVIALYALSHPEKPVVRDLVNEKNWNYKEFNDLINQIANTLIKNNCVCGDRVAIVAKNAGFQLALYLACIRIGCIYTPLNWRLSKAELADLLSRSDPRLTLSDTTCTGLVENTYSLESFERDCAVASVGIEYPAQKNPDRASLILFTSGTSGKPKGVLLSYQNLVSSGYNFAQLTNVTAESRFLAEAPMFHTIGLVANIWPVLLSGGSILVSDGFEADRTLSWLGDEALGISHYVGVPQMIEEFRHQKDFSPTKLKRLSALVTGGAPHSQADILKWLDDGVTLVSGFGMSEAGSVLGMPVNISLIRKKVGSAGVSAPATQLRVVDDEGNDCAVNSPGELWVKGDSVMLNYFNDKPTTDTAFSEERWFKSGDIVRCDEDGFFWIVDRKKDMFISGGENIYPAEIEAALSDYPGLKEFAVVGVKDEKWGEVGCIYAVPKNVEMFDRDDVYTFLRTRLASFKIPKKIVVKDELPRTSTGKLQKAKLSMDS